ncbi:hypothetical protein Kpol_1063p1 [Vanderwaltozyma polyspora DSM 70294]|uniref:Uncharacterized protein n=1 Tax=Vanderwaltozyma polyspora (strain ATCC 22028 / DSM 70294 / BCRC 21397 / CBS 2163 / NBRC 10782 / NRRL Y-8283 / UCD 57-17) TaxID=436907 RepID=A7TQP6_VANPO|nr:uncharacterized protein Kpol_1063p1 [Vanderwaltozyma polyspora DSM 70294]EDO15391.1 hypothetical protein Kpol_1063p1 [Vanderwaltozyma polyspora DSM 70294]
MEAHPEEQIQKYISIFLWNIIRIIQFIIPVIASFSKEHPTLFLSLFSLFALYVIYRIFSNIISIIRRLFYILIILFGVFCYLRGFDQVLGKDIPMLYKLLIQDKNFETAIVQWTAYLTSTSVNGSAILFNFVKARVVEYVQDITRD